jgi:hypothetical protein
VSPRSRAAVMYPDVAEGKRLCLLTDSWPVDLGIRESGCYQTFSSIYSFFPEPKILVVHSINSAKE